MKTTGRTWNWRVKMTKSTVTRLFVGGIASVFAGIVFGFVALWVAFAGGAFQMSGPDVIGVNGGYFSWTMVALIVLGIVAIVGGAIAGLVSWIGALLNTAQLEDKTWFILLLVLGLFSFGLIAMIAYVIAGPDGTRARPMSQPTAQSPSPA
jgi:hypothetical protein